MSKQAAQCWWLCSSYCTELLNSVFPNKSTFDGHPSPGPPGPAWGWSPFYCFPGLGFLKVSHTSKDDVWSLLCLACFIQHNDFQLRSACWKWQDFVSFGGWILLFGIGSTFSLFLQLLMDTGWFHIFTIVITALAKYLGAHPEHVSCLRKLTWVNFNF